MAIKKTFGDTINQYVEYVRTKFSPNVIVFDPEDAAMKSTKYAERLRRQQKQTCADIIFDISMKPIVTQEKFLSNDHNKSRLISMFCNLFNYSFDLFSISNKKMSFFQKNQLEWLI